ncbi:Yip1 family protein [Williamsia phyllosphaerae]|uniref:Yip1 family protein n=1 Tax=Williamsia phyllosphaerae TaxID=885042 RepID=UPI001669E635|nr:Yip1 family protein [Williamsia phyllosphaerae]
MLSAQKTRSGIPTEQQSVLPTVRGVPWWGAVLVALVPTVIGAVIDGSGQSELATTFRVLYFIGCVAAVLLVRRRSLFTAVTQPPLVAFGVAVITFYLVKPGGEGGLKDLIINVLLPIAKLFPLMAWTFAAVLLLGLGRWFLTRSLAEKAPKRSASRRADRPTATRARTSRPETAGAGARSGSRAAGARRDDDAEPPRSRRREAPATRAPEGAGRTSRRSADEATRVQPPARRRVDSPAGSREPLRSAMPRDRDRDRDDVPREPRPRPSGHRRSADGPAAEPLRDQPGGRLPPRRPRPDPFDDLRPPSAPRARYRGVNP